MKTDLEIRDESWRLLWKRHWFWKYLGGTFLINFCTQFVCSLVTQIVIHAVVICTVGLSTAAKLQSGQGFADMKITPVLIVVAVVLVAILVTVQLVAGGVAGYGTAAVLVRSVDDKPDNWLEAAFSGIKMPIQLGWLALRYSLAYLPWLAPALIPCAIFLEGLGDTIPIPKNPSPDDIMVYTLLAMTYMTAVVAVLCIPFYRYRYLFRIKADHPDWTAGQCMRACVDLTSGFKWRSFLHDCSYWRILLLPLGAVMFIFAIIAATVLACASGLLVGGTKAAVIILAVLLGLIAYIVLLASGFVVAAYISVGQTILYREFAWIRFSGRDDGGSLDETQP